MPTRAEIRSYLRGDNIFIDIVTLLLSYAFILFAAWDDGLLGLEPSIATHCAEYLLAAGLACEIVVRLIIVRQRPWYFYPLIVVDAISVLTVIPGFVYVTFARIARLTVSAARMLRLIDRISRKHGNPYLVLLVYPLIVPLAAALFFLIEQGAANTQVHNYFQSLVLMMSYSLTLGIATHHPVTYAGKIIAGLMLLSGFMCVSIIGNALTTRYSIVRAKEAPRD